ncbi:MAG: hypothetical protein KAR40_12930 [Candidatus Sabulitectum sp.]|nr:hypothetical protein [Candidatus Sabulitectum sp.]
MVLTLIPILAVLLSFFNFFSLQPGSVSLIEIHNAADSGDLVAVYSVMPGEMQISPNLLDSPLPEDSSIWLAIPGMLYPAIIGLTSSDLSYREVSFAAVDSATIEFDRMRREYGRLINKVYGPNRLSITNSSQIQLVSISVSDSSGFPGEVLLPDVIFPGEAINVWLDSGSYNVSVRDRSSASLNYSISIDSGSIASIKLTLQDFIQENTVSYVIGEGSCIVKLVSALPVDSLCALDLYNLNGESIAGYDLQPTLSCWQKLTVYTEEPVSWLSAWDTNDRSYSLNAPDSVLGAYIIDVNCVDFDISFDKNNDWR